MPGDLEEGKLAEERRRRVCEVGGRGCGPWQPGEPVDGVGGHTPQRRAGVEMRPP